MPERKNKYSKNYLDKWENRVQLGLIGLAALGIIVLFNSHSEEIRTLGNAMVITAFVSILTTKVGFYIGRNNR